MLRRYADWRPVAVRRVPVEWWGAGMGLASALLVFAVTHKFTYLVVFASGFVAHWTTRQMVERRMKDLRDDAEGGQFAAVLSLSREVPYGFDEGLVAFIDGWLVYSGRRCAFSVRREDVLELKSNGKRDGFVFQGPAGRHLASFKVAEQGRFGKEFGRWARAEGVVGEPVFPPSTPNEAAYPLYGWWAAFAVSALVVALAVAVLLEPEAGYRAFYGFLAVVTLPALVVYAVDARRALSRIADGLPHRRHRLSHALGIAPPDDGPVPLVPKKPE